MTCKSCGRETDMTWSSLCRQCYERTFGCTFPAPDELTSLRDKLAATQAELEETKQNLVKYIHYDEEEGARADKAETMCAAMKAVVDAARNIIEDKQTVMLDRFREEGRAALAALQPKHGEGT